jgi:UDP-N-acetylglucosamine--N-acetylmuramyl-(pentapeptide) pyrophosphoryl-undecaprenol N-acetylglucosamine transferase
MIAEALLEVAVARGHEVIFIGSTSGQDQKYFKNSSKFSDVYFLDTSGVVNKRGFGKIKALWAIIKAFFTARKLLRKHKIEAVYSVGGFSAAPAAFASITCGLPLFIHEQNAIIGKLNTILKPFAKSFTSAYDKSSSIKGYPVKKIFFDSAHTREDIKTIIFLGGSQGAKAINDLALSVAIKLSERGIKIIHQCGEKEYERVQDTYGMLGIDVELYGFTKELHTLISRADLAVSRAGASTLWELTSNGLVAFFIPYPYAAADHQYHNAHYIVANNLGWCHREGEDLEALLTSLLDENLKEKSQKLLTLNSKNVAELMIKEVEKVVM